MKRKVNYTLLVMIRKRFSLLQTIIEDITYVRMEEQTLHLVARQLFSGSAGNPYWKAKIRVSSVHHLTAPRIKPIPPPLRKMVESSYLSVYCQHSIHIRYIS